MKKNFCLYLGLGILLLLYGQILSAAKPTVKISASPATIYTGQTSTLTWSSTSATSASINNGIGSVPVNGSKTVTPTRTTTYTITVKGSGGTATAKATVTVKVAAPTVTISVSPASISPGQSATLNWSSTNTTSASIDNGIGAVAVSGSKTVTPGQTTTYTITVSGPGGTSTSSATLSVNVLPTVTLTATPKTFHQDEAVTLTWNSTSATSAEIDNGIGIVDLNGSRQVTPQNTTTYMITAIGPGGMSYASVTVYLSTGRQCYAYIANSDSKNIMVVDADNCSLMRTIPREKNPWAVLLDPDGTCFYLGDNSQSGLFRMDTARERGDDTPLGDVQGHPKFMAVNSGQNYIYTTNHVPVWDPLVSGNYFNVVACIQTSQKRLELIREVGIPNSSETLSGIAVHPDGTKIYVGNPSDNNILILDAAKMHRYVINPVMLSDELIGTIQLEKPVDLAISPDGNRLYAAHNTHLSVIDTTNNTVVQMIEMNQLPDSSAIIPPVLMRLSLDGKQLVAARANDTLSIIDTTTLTVIKNNVGTGVYGVSGLAIHPDGSRLYVIGYVTYYVGRMIVLDAATMTTVGTLDLGCNPRAVNNFVGYPADTVSGRVTRDNSGVSGAVIDMSGEGITRQAATDAAGTYALAARPGRCTLLPTYLNFAFAPEKIDLTVDGSKANQDFIITGIAPAPSITLTANPTSVLQGDSTTLTWTTTNAREVYVDAKQSPLNGSKVVTPYQTDIYEATASGPGGSARATVKVEVISRPYPVINYFKATPSVIAPGGKAVLSWTSSYTSTASIDNGVGSVPTSGSVTVSPTLTTTYRLTVQGRTLKTADITVSTDVTLPSVSISADPQMIIAGNNTTLSWTSTNADSASIDNGVGSVPVTGSINVSPLKTATYIITVTGSKGTATDKVTITVEAAPLPTVQISADPQIVNPPQTSTLAWTSTNAQSVSIDNGIGSVPLSGSIDVTPTQDTNYTITAAGYGGTVFASVTVKTLASHLTSIWNNMKLAMQNGDIEQAVSFFIEESKPAYREIYTQLSSQLAQIARDMGEIEPMAVEENMAIFRIKRLETIQGKEYQISYRIYFVNQEGIWLIYKY